MLGRYDVVVIGGGTGGAPAGIGAARQGAKTLVVEYLHGLGGVGTEGAIASYYWGNRVGFHRHVSWRREPSGRCRTEEGMVSPANCSKAGADIWFGSIGCGAFVDGDRVRGAVVATPYGRGVVLANTVIDATGNSDIAAAAGAECIYTDDTEFGMQGTGLPGRRLGGTYNNTDFTIVDETDMVDVWHMFVYSKEKYPDAFDHGRLIDTRERRRIVGDYHDHASSTRSTSGPIRTPSRSRGATSTRTATRSTRISCSNIPRKWASAFPSRFEPCCPKAWTGSWSRVWASAPIATPCPLIRMQADIQNGGYAAGVAAAMASYAETTIRRVDIRRLQEHLVKIGNLPETVLEDKDSFPLPAAALAEAVRSLPEGRGAAVLLTDPARALPLLRSRLRPGDRRCAADLRPGARHAG